jgi:hypothetical protein
LLIYLLKSVFENEMNLITATDLTFSEIMASEILWEEKNYPDLFMPVSPCISLQWCYRDGKLVNLPWALLVHGDVIVLQAAQKILADCELIGVSKS